MLVSSGQLLVRSFKRPCESKIGLIDATDHQGNGIPSPADEAGRLDER